MNPARPKLAEYAIPKVSRAAPAPVPQVTLARKSPRRSHAMAQSRWSGCRGADDRFCCSCHQPVARPLQIDNRADRRLRIGSPRIGSPAPTNSTIASTIRAVPAGRTPTGKQAPTRRRLTLPPAKRNRDGRSDRTHASPRTRSSPWARSGRSRARERDRRVVQAGAITIVGEAAQEHAPACRASEHFGAKRRSRDGSRRRSAASSAAAGPRQLPRGSRGHVHLVCK